MIAASSANAMPRAGPIQQVMTVQSPANSWFWQVMLNPFTAIWTIFLFWLVGKIVQDTVENYVAAPLASYSTIAADHMIKRYDTM